MEHRELAADNELDLFATHGPGLAAACRRLSECQPDVIIALARKGPRLLEVMRQAGLLKSAAPVLTEKALEALAPGELAGKRVVVFDDIIISGTTIAALVTQLSLEYDAHVEVVAVAVDSTTIKLQRVTETEYQVEVPARGPVQVHAFISLPRGTDTRFVFCERVAKSIVRLAKPYDIDFPIFHATLTEASLSSFFARDTAYNVYSVGTEHTNRFDTERLSLLPRNPAGHLRALSYIAPAASVPNTGGKPADGTVLKSRLYWNRTSAALRIVPMVSFSFETTNPRPFFCAELSGLNAFLQSVATRDLALRGSELLVFRVYWYLLNFVVGYSLLWRILGSTEMKSRPARSLVDRDDLVLLFGPSLSDEVLDLLDAEGPAFVQAARSGRSAPMPAAEPHQQTEPAVLWDQERAQLASDIAVRLSRAAVAETYIARKLACVFEAMYFEIEVRAQRLMLANGLDQSQARRLQTGFNAQQLTDLLATYCGYDRSDDTLRDLSLSFDYLVDLGVMIPVFVRRPANQGFERAYRYGEEALCVRKFSLFVASMLEHLGTLIRARKTQFDGVMPRVTFEKIGVIVIEEMRRYGYLDALTLDSRFGEVVSVDLAFSRHGRVVELRDSRGGREQFNSWCEVRGIVSRVPSRGVALNPNFLTLYKTETDEVPAATDLRVVYRLAKMAYLAYLVDRDIDESKSNDMLVALTTTRTNQDYLRSIREELRLLFESPRYSLAQCVGALEEWASIGSTAPVAKGRRLAAAATSAAGDMERKSGLWRDFDQTVAGIDTYARASFDPLLLSDYLSEFRPYLSWIEEKRASEGMSSSAYVLRASLEDMGRLCRAVGSSAMSLLDLAEKSTRLRFKRGRTTSHSRAGEHYLYVSDYNQLRR